MNSAMCLRKLNGLVDHAHSALSGWSDNDLCSEETHCLRRSTLNGSAMVITSG